MTSCLYQNHLTMYHPVGNHHPFYILWIYYLIPTTYSTNTHLPPLLIHLYPEATVEYFHLYQQTYQHLLAISSKAPCWSFSQSPASGVGNCTFDLIPASKSILGLKGISFHQQQNHTWIVTHAIPFFKISDHCTRIVSLLISNNKTIFF